MLDDLRAVVIRSWSSSDFFCIDFEAAARDLQLLQADNIRLGLGEPTRKDRQPAIDAVDVKGCDLHAAMRRVER